MSDKLALSPGWPGPTPGCLGRAARSRARPARTLPCCPDPAARSRSPAGLDPALLPGPCCPLPLLGEQLADGGWNCEAPQSRRSSFHTTICVLEGLLEYEKAKGATAAVTEARVRAQEYLLERGMFRSLSSGEVIDRTWTRFSFPTTWHYDVLQGLDYLRSAGVEPDERVAEAVALVAKKQHQNGRWPLQNPHPDRVDFDLEAGAGKASRWNTRRALRVLDWYSARD